MVGGMNTRSPHWSQTSSRLMSACPRAWALTYGSRQETPLSRKDRTARGSQPPRTVDEVMVRAMRAAWQQKIADLYDRKVWTTAYAKRTLSRLVYDMLEEQRLTLPDLLREQKIALAMRQLNQLEHVHALRPLFNGEPRRWAFFDRRDPVSLNGLDLYAAPDLAVFHQNRWTLIRLQFRTPHANPMGQQLEHLLAVLWALQQTGFPDDAGSFRMKVVAWRGSRWHEHHLEVTPQSLHQARLLALHDVQEMNWLTRWANADPSLSTLPLAAHHRTCERCVHRKGCPAETGLAKAKRIQEHLTRHEPHKAPTKSARTE